LKVEAPAETNRTRAAAKIAAGITGTSRSGEKAEAGGRNPPPCVSKKPSLARRARSAAWTRADMRPTAQAAESLEAVITPLSTPVESRVSSDPLSLSPAMLSSAATDTPDRSRSITNSMASLPKSDPSLAPGGAVSSIRIIAESGAHEIPDRDRTASLVESRSASSRGRMASRAARDMSMSAL